MCTYGCEARYEASHCGLIHPSFATSNAIRTLVRVTIAANEKRAQMRSSISSRVWAGDPSPWLDLAGFARRCLCDCAQWRQLRAGHEMERRGARGAAARIRSRCGRFDLIRSALSVQCDTDSRRVGVSRSRFMILNPLLPRVTTALLEAEPAVSPCATCPLCHTTHGSLTPDALEAGGTWRCVRCGQWWDADRLAAVAAYSAWVVERDTVSQGRGNPSDIQARAPSLPR